VQQVKSSLLHQVENSILPLPPPPTQKTEDRRPPKELQKRERLPHWKASRPATAPSGRVLDRSPRDTSGIAQGMMARSPSHVCGTHITGATAIVRDAASVMKGLFPRYSEASCTMLVFCDAFKRRATSPNMMAKPTPASGWRIISSCVGREGQLMICSSFSSSLSIWPNPLGPGWTISRETPSTAGMTYCRSLPAISRAPTCNTHFLQE
jgi:hypothetical protein